MRININPQFYSIKQFYFIVFIALFFVGCATVDKTTKDKTSDSYLPPILHNIQLGMSKDAVLKIRNKAYVVNSIQETPRSVFTEDIEDGTYNSVYYFFSKTENEALVEINILHSSSEAAKQTIQTYFGENQTPKGGPISSTKQNQWHKTLKNGTEIHATWRNQKVFIYQDVATEKEEAIEKAAEE